MKTMEINLENLRLAKEKIPANVPVMMLNLLRYKDQADYGEQHDQSAPSSGRDVYFQRYAPAFNQVASNLKVTGIAPFWVGNVLASLVAPDIEQWDDIVLVAYPDFEAFCLVVESEDYLIHAAHHRLAALEDWRLIAMVKINLA